jgi:hypothetical protein
MTEKHKHFKEQYDTNMLCIKNYSNTPPDFVTVHKEEKKNSVKLPINTG